MTTSISRRYESSSPTISLRQAEEFSIEKEKKTVFSREENDPKLSHMCRPREALDPLVCSKTFSHFSLSHERDQLGSASPEDDIKKFFREKSENFNLSDDKVQSESGLPWASEQPVFAWQIHASPEDALRSESEWIQWYAWEQNEWINVASHRAARRQQQRELGRIHRGTYLGTSMHGWQKPPMSHLGLQGVQEEKCSDRSEKSGDAQGA
jgi:hypothetical protein